MYWKDEGYLLSKTNFDENSIIINAFTLNHGKYSGVVYGGASRKQKKNFQVGNKILLNWRSKGENKLGYFNIELIKPIAPQFFDDKKRSICVLSASTILKILLPEGQINKKIYESFESLINQFISKDWIKLYIYWELSLIKELGFEVNLLKNENNSTSYENTIKLNDKNFIIPELLINNHIKNPSNIKIKEALLFNKLLLMENFIIPNKLKLPLSRNILEKYYS